MTTVDLYPDSASQPDRPVPFPAMADALRAKRTRTPAHGLYDTAPAPDPRSTRPQPMTPAVPMQALDPPSRVPRIAAITGGLLILAAAGGASFLWNEDAPVAAPARTVTPQPTAPSAEVSKPAPEPAAADPQADLRSALDRSGLTLDDLERIESTRAMAAAYRSAPNDPAKAEALTKAVASVSLSRADVKRKLYHLTKLMRTLDASDVDPKEVGPVWRELLGIRKDFEAEAPDLADLAKRMTAVEQKARSLLP